MKRAHPQAPARLRRDARAWSRWRVGVGAYILTQQRLRFPLIEDKPFDAGSSCPDAQGVTPGQGQTVRVAGMRVGDIGEVELEDGRRSCRMDLEPRVRRPRAPATPRVLLRPRTGLKDMFLALDPGTPARAACWRRATTIPIDNTAPDVNADEILSALDTDTRDYLKLLINGAGKGLEGRGERPARGVPPARAAAPRPRAS